MSADDAVSAVIGAFRAADLVGLGERHWSREHSEFRLQLIRHPTFAQTTTDIVVEFATAGRQDILNAFVEGAAVPRADLMKVWEDTTQAGAWASPVYEEFFHAVRSVNEDLPRDRKLRIVAADPGAGSGYAGREEFAAAVIEKEILRRGRKALVLFGALHLYRNHPGNLVAIVSAAKWFVIVPVTGTSIAGSSWFDAAGPTDPVLITLSDNPAGELSANELFEKGTKRIKLAADGKPLLVKRKPVFLDEDVFPTGQQARDVADAVLYFGAATDSRSRPFSSSPSETR